jgi:hypothetical protein
VPTRLRITPSTHTLTSLGETIDLLAQVLDAQGNPMLASGIEWISTDPAVASVDDAGHVTALGNGTARVIARSAELGDTARITVAVEEEEVVAQSAGVVITPAVDTVSVGGAVSLMAEVRDAQGNRLAEEFVHWRSLDAAADVSSAETAVLTSVTVTGRAPGVARIVATHDTGADTAVITVAGGTTPNRSVKISVDADTIPSVGAMLQLSASVVDASGNVVGNQGITWTSLDLAIATVSSAGVVQGLSRGVAIVTATFQSTVDTVFIFVEPGVGVGGGTPQTGLTIQAAIVGYSGTGSVLVSSGIPIPPGLLQADDTKKVVVYVNGKEQSLYVEALAGRHPDGSVRSMLVQMRYPVVAGQSVPAQIVAGSAVIRTTQDLPRSSPIFGYGNPLPQAALLPTSPSYLIGSGIVGATMPAPSSFNGKYESNFKSIGDAKWSIVKSKWGTALLDANAIVVYNSYDRALMNFAWWARTGDPEYWRRAVLYELAYRDLYLRLNGYRVQPHNIQIEGLELHYLLTGDRESLNGVTQAAEYYWQFWLPEIGDQNGTWVEARIQARTLEGLSTAARLGLTQHDYAGAARSALTKILGTQQADGSYRFRSICNTQYNYMTGLLNDAMIKYYTFLDKDTRIIGAMKRSLDFMWSSQWIKSAGAFQYATGYCPGIADTSPAPDLNLLIVNGYGWYAKVTGDLSYRQIGDTVFNMGVANAWLGNTAAQGDKQFNQQYRSAFRYLAYRQ